MALTKVHNRMIDQNIFDVVDFGADPTGVADSRSAINSAFAACEAAGAGTVLFPNGTYYCSDYVGTTFSANLTDIKVIGNGSKINLNPTTAANYSLYLYWPNLNSILVKGIEIDGNTKTATGIIIRNQSTTASCVSAVVEDCAVRNLHGVDDASISANPIGIYIDSTFEGNKAVIRNCLVENVTRDKTGLSNTGMSITKFRVATIEGNSIQNIRHSGTSGDKVDADGIKVFSSFQTVGSDNVYYDINASIRNNVVYNCEGRFVKTQANGQVKIDNNSFRVQSAIELIDNFVGVDCQTGEGLVTNNDFFFGNTFTGGSSACAFKAQCPPESTYDFRSFTQEFSGNKIDIRNKIPYVILPTTPATSTTNSFKLYLNVLNNTVNVADADSTFTTTDQTTERPSYFMYVNNSNWPTAANLNGEMHWKVVGNVVDTYEFLTLTSGSEDYTGKWFLHIHNNVKYPTGFARNLLSSSTSYTSNLSLSNNNIGDSGTGGVFWPFDFTELIAPCDFYVGNPTLTNGPASYTYRNVQFNGNVWKVFDATGVYLTQDCTTWTRVT